MSLTAVRAHLYPYVAKPLVAVRVRAYPNFFFICWSDAQSDETSTFCGPRPVWCIVRSEITLAGEDILAKRPMALNVSTRFKQRQQHFVSLQGGPREHALNPFACCRNPGNIPRGCVNQGVNALLPQSSGLSQMNGISIVYKCTPSRAEFSWLMKIPLESGSPQLSRKGTKWAPCPRSS